MEWQGFDRWYRTMMHFVIFGSEDDSIVVKDWMINEPS